jgi:hypothetical protein
MGNGRIFLKTRRDVSFNKVLLMSLISAGSISLDSTFKLLKLSQAYLVTTFKQCLLDLNKERMEMAFRRQKEILEKELRELQN